MCVLFFFFFFCVNWLLLLYHLCRSFVNIVRKFID